MLATVLAELRLPNCAWGDRADPVIRAYNAAPVSRSRTRRTGSKAGTFRPDCPGAERASSLIECRFELNIDGSRLTHLRSIYQKLEVTSRSQVLERAAGLRLL